MRRLAAAFGLVTFVVCAVAGPAVAGSAPATVKLPTEADGAAYAPGEQGILFGQKGVETRLPGPVTDRETVTVGLDLNGTPNRVAVEQHLTVSGLGDFEFRVPGPARDIRALPGSQDQPGLRKGSALWQGFSPGTKQLAATMDLFPDQEAARLPLRVHLSMTVNGHPLVPGRPQSGAFAMALIVENVSAIPVRVSTGPTDPARVASILDTVHHDLTVHRRPAPGSDGIPTDVALTGPARALSVPITVPFRVAGSFTWPVGALTEVDSKGPLTSTGTGVSFDMLLEAPPANTMTIRLTGQAHRLGLPGLAVTATPSVPSPKQVENPSGGSWVGSPVGVNSADVLELLMRTMWEVARLRQFDGYLGNPDVTGASRSTYRFVLAPTSPAAIHVADTLGRVSLLGTVLFGLIVLVAMAGLARAWARA